MAPVNLRLTVDVVSVVGGPADDTVDIPSACAQRSRLITNIKEQAASEEFVPLPLSWEEVHAWLTCAASGVNRSGRGDECLEAEVHVDSLLRALKAADFLEDAETKADVLRGLGAAMVGRELMQRPAPDNWAKASEAEHRSRLAESKAERTRWRREEAQLMLGAAASDELPTQEQRANAAQIVAALPPSSVVDVISAVHRSSYTCSLGLRSILPAAAREVTPSRRHVHLLFELLPRPLHPAVVHVCCRDHRDTTCLIVNASSVSLAESIGDDQAAESQPRDDGASATFLMLAAAAPLAGGTLEGAYTMHSASAGAPAPEQQHGVGVHHMHADVSPSTAGGVAGTPGSQQSPGPPCAPAGASDAAMHARLPVDTEGAGGVAVPPDVSAECHLWQQGQQLKRLQLVVFTRPPGEPPRWCTALAQLRTLRALRVDVYCAASAFSAREFGAALAGLPALQSLSMDSHPTSADRDDGDPAANIASPKALQLIDGIASARQLSHLELRDCIVFTDEDDSNEASGDDADFQAELAAAAAAAPHTIMRLSQLSQLTCLTLTTVLTSPAFLDILAGAVKLMLSLQELSVALFVPENPPPASLLLLALFDGPDTCMPALERLHWSIRQTQPPADVADWQPVPLADLHGLLDVHHTALLRRLTSLHLPSCWLTPDQGEALAALVAALPSLQSLELKFNNIGDAALTGLAQALSGLLGLRHLGLGATGGSAAGLIAVMRVLQDNARACAEAGLDSLQHLDASRCRIGPGRAAELAAVLRGLRCLETVRLQDTGLEEAGLRRVVPALAALPCLRRRGVNLLDNVTDDSDEFSEFAGAGFACLGDTLARREMAPY